MSIIPSEYAIFNIRAMEFHAVWGYVTQYLSRGDDILFVPGNFQRILKFRISCMSRMKNKVEENHVEEKEENHEEEKEDKEC